MCCHTLHSAGSVPEIGIIDLLSVSGRSRLFSAGNEEWTIFYRKVISHVSEHCRWEKCQDLPSTRSAP
ncbi:hypothetical protein Y032_0248g78 [Ancylostoma ceylanicum]|uniref:Uncharacterized protein n=1 Tax=Ancylostoma ceylanicum TaxID=53326 RepID=A0A016SDD2_9BILA|nr:hypothetical protein Y032_0248g78 [Ancylostoma ceylanicum]